MKTNLHRHEVVIGLFTLLYVTCFVAWFLMIGNYEFIVYVVTMIGLISLIGVSLRSAEYPAPLLWSLSVWGLLHMAGGGVPMNGSVLYNLVVIPITAVGDSIVLKYDQLVHAFGFGVTAWLLHHLLTRHYPVVRGTATALVFPALASMGLGAANEIIEFSAVLAVPDTNVGGYVNTALDLCFNALGAIVAVSILGLTTE